MSDIKWQTFILSNIFDIRATASSIDRKKLNGKSGIVPYITRTDNNNGFDSFIADQENYKTDDGNVITVGLDTQTAFYQPVGFYTGQNIQVLSNEHLNKHNALFIIPLLKQLMQKFSWGGNGATLTRLKRSKLLLPATEDGNPNWVYMVDYMKAHESKLISRYEQYLETLKLPAKQTISEREWQEFLISEIFDIEAGKRLIKADMKTGKTPFVGATDSNNGITAYTSNANSSRDENVLGVNYNGSVGETFYHPYEALISDDVKRFKLKNCDGNKYIYLFLKSEILKQKAKYQYGYKFNEERMKKQTILLPIDANGQPDWNYMDACERERERELMTTVKRWLVKLRGENTILKTSSISYSVANA